MNYTSKETDLIVADSIAELNYKQKKLLLASENREAEDGQKYAEALIKTLDGGVYNKIREKFRDQTYRGQVLAALEKKGVECTTVKSADYPEHLGQIPAPPLVLYLKGDRALLGTRKFAVVGSRRTTAQMTEACKKICAELSEKLTIVTGVADGADGAAAKGALKNGRVICVLPGGHSHSGAANADLLRKVEQNGLSISEFPPSTKVQRHTFLLRNRIIAGLSEGVLVVSAAEKSGALSTASYAANYSRDVFAFPYGLGSPSGAGCNALIKSGAYLCDGAGDILGVLGIEQVEKKIEPELNGDERAVYELLKEQGETHAEAIAAALGVTLTDALTLCSLMEIKGLIIRTGGNAFAAI
ncbi:MAG: DNA-processing protein DprA [Clostridia bacterium]|nr:DNA-processing protein DprA [Clostridia bacterium]